MVPVFTRILKRKRQREESRKVGVDARRNIPDKPGLGDWTAKSGLLGGEPTMRLGAACPTKGGVGFSDGAMGKYTRGHGRPRCALPKPG
jgi:hypothetical protein